LAADDPRKKLPVTAGPAVLALARDIVAGGKLLNQLNIRGEASARKNAFEQVVTQQRVVWNATGERRFEGVDVIDALPSVGTLIE
jgi:hypothetical protein